MFYAFLLKVINVVVLLIISGCWALFILFANINMMTTIKYNFTRLTFYQKLIFILTFPLTLHKIFIIQNQVLIQDNMMRYFLFSIP